jgi:hypothetical protein
MIYGYWRLQSELLFATEIERSKPHVLSYSPQHSRPQLYEEAGQQHVESRTSRNIAEQRTSTYVYAIVQPGSGFHRVVRDSMDGGRPGTNWCAMTKTYRSALEERREDNIFQALAYSTCWMDRLRGLDALAENLIQLEWAGQASLRSAPAAL